MLLLAVFLVSLSSLSFEVTLARVFSITQWNHLSFMVISIALFGFAASGTFLSILSSRISGWEKKMTESGPIKTILLLYILTAILSFTVVNRLPLDYFKLPLEFIQAFYLLVAYFLFSLPFFFAGLTISLAYSAFPQKTGIVYLATMTGSACGAVLPALLLTVVGEGQLLILVSLFPLILLPFGGIDSALPENREHRTKRSRSTGEKVVFTAACLSTILAASVVYVSPLVQIRPSPYKGLSERLRFPETRITETSTGIRGRIDRVTGTHIRFAPGLSLQYKGGLPVQEIVYTDGDNGFTLYDPASGQDAHFSRYSLPFAGFLLITEPDSILLIQHGGGSGIPAAIASGAREITIIEQQPRIAGIVASHYNLAVVNENPRAFLNRSEKRFDIIQVERWGNAPSGSSALNQEHLLTVPAFDGYLNHLTERGVLIISRKLVLPPSDLLRVWGAAYEGLRISGIHRPERHMAVLRNWDLFTLIVSAKPLDDTKVLKDFAKRMNFDLVFLPGISEDMTNRFNRFDQPYHFHALRRLADAYRKGEEKGFFQSYLLDISPQTDARPFPDRFLKWSRIDAIYQSIVSRMYALFMSGEMIVAVVFFEALTISLFLLICPLAVIRGSGKRLRASRFAYFFSVGAGFMFLELFFIKSYTFLFGDPVISLTVVLSGMLVFSGIGGCISRRMSEHRHNLCLLLLTTFLFIAIFGFSEIEYRMLKAPSTLRYLLAGILLAPAGILAGMPFPLGMRHLLETPVQRAHAWSANGIASVLASVASAQVAVSLGIPVILICAVASYLVALISLSRNGK